MAEPPPSLIDRQMGLLLRPNQSRTQQVVGRLGPDGGRGRRRRRLDGEEESLEDGDSLRFSSVPRKAS